MDSLLQDIRYAVRTCLRSPGFTAVAVTALALGIGANTAIFTIVNAVLIERLPFRDPDRIVVIWEETARRPGRPNSVGPANFIRWRERSSAFESTSAFFDTRMNLTGSGEPEEIIAQVVTAEFFSTLGASPFIGRTFAANDAIALDELVGNGQRSGVAVLSHGFWQRHFGGDPTIVGKTIQLDGTAIPVVGVMPADTQLLLKNGTLVGRAADLWLPFRFTDAQREPRGRYLASIGRLKAGMPLTEARAQMRTIAAGLAEEFPRFDAGWSVRLIPLHEELSGEIRPALLVLSGAVAFVLLIACANVANLLLARGAARQREIAIRRALGATRRRVVRQLLTESLVLGLLGGAIGLLVAQWSLDFLLALSPVNLAGLGDIRLSNPVLAFTAAVSMLTAVVCGFAPAFDGSRDAVQESLKEGSRQVGGGSRARRMRHAFVVAEIALAVVLLVGAGLMVRSFSRLRGVDPGFDSHHVLTVRAAIPTSKYKEDAQRLRFFQEAVGRIRALPGVEAAGAISFLPFAGLGAGTSFHIVGQAPSLPGQDPITDVRVCDVGYFQAMRIPLVRGRLFTEREMRENARVVIINETLARRYFPNEEPIGHRLEIAMAPPIVPTEIIGVVADVRQMDLVAEMRPMTYWPHPQLAYSAMTFTIRTASDPLALAPMVERTIQTIDKDQPVSDVRSMDQWVVKSLAETRFSSMLLTVFAGLALLLAAIGIYGVMAYTVSQRTAEIGIRLALGAHQRDILRMVVGDGLRLALAGVVAGIVLALALTRTLTTLLYGTRPTDPLTFASVICALAAVALFASYLPARRAARIAPTDALRCQ